MTLRERVTLAFMKRLLGTAEGRAHLLNQVADAESNGENQVFEHVLAHIDDPKLRKMVEKHQADEIRHEQMFRACVERTGIQPGAVPSHLKLIDRLDAAIGHFFQHPITDATGVMEAYLLLQVVEERAVTQFALFEQVFRDIDPVIADTFAEVARDEERHLKYCHAIARRYAPNAETHDETLARFRSLEARCFAENGQANMEYTFARGWFKGGAISKWFFRQIQQVGLRSGSLPYTTFATPAAA